MEYRTKPKPCSHQYRQVSEFIAKQVSPAPLFYCIFCLDFVYARDFTR